MEMAAVALPPGGPDGGSPASEATPVAAAEMDEWFQSVYLSVVDTTNLNLSEPERELLRWHFRLGHIGMKKVQFLMRSGALAHTKSMQMLHARAGRLSDLPKCAACQFGKQTLKSIPGTVEKRIQDKRGLTKQEATFPGERVFSDHFVCGTRGRLLSGRGKTAESNMYCGGCVMVDAASGLIWVDFQRALNSHETLQSKEEFERFCRDHGVVPQQFVADNGTAYTSADFTKHLAAYAQAIRHVAPGAHHQNPAERAIRTISSIARTMMIHSSMHWPDMADTSLWPMAVQHAVYLYNHVPDPATGLAPIDLFTRTRKPLDKLKDLHVWGCPTYLLAKSLADGKKIPRWQPRTQRTVYLGTSPQHVSVVPLVLNPDTGSITAQYHVVFDDWFATVTAPEGELPDFMSEEWKKVFSDIAVHHADDPDGDDDLPPLSDLPSPQQSAQRERVQSSFQQQGAPYPASPVPAPVDTSASGVAPAPQPTQQREREQEAVVSTPLQMPQEVSEPVVPSTAPPTPASPAAPTSPVSPTVSPPVVRRSTRDTKPVARLDPNPSQKTYDSVAAHLGTPDFLVATLHKGSTSLGDMDSLLAAHSDCKLPHHVNLLLDHPLCLKASASDPDTLSYDQAMASDEREQWIKAAEEEVRGLEKFGTWEEVPESEAKKTTVPVLWVFRRKRDSSGEVTRHKARLTCRGDLMGDYGFETYAPVVGWPTVRMFLVMSLVLGWQTCSIDYTQAFLNAELSEEDTIWIRIPRGFKSTKP